MADRSAKPEGRAHKRIISDQQKRRDIALQRQSQSRRDLQHHARQLVSLAVPLSSSSCFGAQDAVSVDQDEEISDFREKEHMDSAQFKDFATNVDNNEVDALEIEEENAVGMLQATKLKGSKAREWFKQQFMLPEWMVDVPSRLSEDWYVMARPAGERCIVVSSNGATVSRLRNGHILHCFPSALPNGAKTPGVAASSQVFCILDCIFHKADNIYYVIDMMCWRGYSLYDCNYEFRHFWIKSKLEETGIFASPKCHRYQFSIVHAFECDKAGLERAYNGNVPFERDGCLFLNRHAHYVLGITPLALVWKDPASSRYHIDTDSSGNVPVYQQVVLEFQEDGTVATSDDPKVILGSMPPEFLRQNNQHLRTGMLLKFAIGDHGLSIVNGKPVAADIHYQGLANRRRAGADSVSKVLFQYAARHYPLSISHILAAIENSDNDFAMDN
ncbi:hypothetical protein GOP47_0015546 [Adiantum capillus-veneris]|uniref:Snurportin-1 n=1 Tax=Adiantum capillus-veneris TaxID=13818 RepID=A0A9D4UJZ8_ADICA|nr:hypothetical protein GOP47_0015546 [Adiantum capillus-veneris]